MRKTAHISLLVEFDDEGFNTLDAILETTVSDIDPAEGFTVIGTPRAVEHKRPICSVSHDDFIRTLQAMEDRGGGFIRSMAATLSHADSANQRRLMDEFWNEFCKYWRQT